MAAATGSEMDNLMHDALDKYNEALQVNVPCLKDLQIKAIQILINGKDCICSLPTGYGKSLIYEILQFMSNNCLVISIVPLNAIIDQQIQKLGNLAVHLSSKSNLKELDNGDIKFIFSHPEEILNNKNFNDYFSNETFRKKDIQVYLVIDEAHCVLEWGSEFRLQFKQLSQIRSVVQCQVLALSATVTESGQKQISENLLMKTFVVVCASPAKDNIALIVQNRPSPNAKGNTSCTPYDYIFLPLLSELKHKFDDFPITIVYCKSLQWIGYGYQVAKQHLENCFYAGESIPENARVVMFHSSMEKNSGKLKSTILSSLQKPPEECPIRLIFSTIALGMGADLKHVKRIVHAGPLHWKMMESHTADKQRVCKVCEKIFKTDTKLKRHMLIHTGKRPFKCKLCGKRCARYCNLKKHMLVHTGDKMFNCSLCDKRLPSSGALKIHELVHTGEKPFSCKICDYACNQSNNLKTHMLIHTGEKPFKCYLCDYACSLSNSLKKHLRIHTGDKCNLCFICKVCDKRVTSSNSLKQHMMIHTGDKPFSCKLCDYTCTSSSSLKSHLLVHTGDKPFSCILCGYSCSHSNDLKIHMRTHTGDKPFMCHMCGKRFNSSTHLKRHMVVHTGDKKIICSVCGKIFTSSRYLKNHEFIHTGNKPCC